VDHKDTNAALPCTFRKKQRYGSSL